MPYRGKLVFSVFQLGKMRHRSMLWFVWGSGAREWLHPSSSSAVSHKAVCTLLTVMNENTFLPFSHNWVNVGVFLTAMDIYFDKTAKAVIANYKSVSKPWKCQWNKVCFSITKLPFYLPEICLLSGWTWTFCHKDRANGASSLFTVKGTCSAQSFLLLKHPIYS